MKKTWSVLMVVFGALALLAGVGTFAHHLTQIRSEAQNTFRSRHALLTKFVALHRDQVTVMAHLLADRYRLNAAPDPAQLQTRAHRDLNVWELAPPKGAIAGTVSGAGLQALSPQQQREIVAATGMDAQIQAALKFDHDAAWLYYVSASGFIYIAPDVPLAQFHFTPELYQRAYWRDAGPRMNPTRRMMIKGPYNDLGGKGMIVTFAQPVYDGAQFLGVVGLDLRADTLQQLTTIGACKGESMMVSARDQATAGHDAWLRSEVVKDELWLVHRLRPVDLYLAAAIESTGVWAMIALLGLLGVMAWRLRTALTEVTLLMRVDPLTQALNRRGFYERAESTLAYAHRKNLPLALMIMDIDHFKKINDTHGHAVGDSVLKQLGDYVLNSCRPFDLFCRWGGEEFVLILVLDQIDQALSVAERMRQQAHRARINLDTGITLSAGLIQMKAGESIDDAVTRADALLYQAKTNGRNQIMSDLS